MTTTTPQPATTRRTFTIQVFPHVKKFMKKNFTHSRGVFRPDEYSNFGKLITLALKDKRGWKPRAYQDNYFRDRLSEKVTIEISTDQGRMAPRPYKLMRLNIDIDRMFKEHMIVWVNAQLAIGTAAHPACKSFLEFYNLDPDGDEYSLENAYKAWQRAQKGEEN